jgi:hypothetical protein
MADIKLSDLSAIASIGATDLLYVVADTVGVYSSKKTTIANVNTVLDHGLLTGLSDDDHTQYLKLSGRSTGQIVYGGTTASAVLTLNSTSHATKGITSIDTFCRIDGAAKTLAIRYGSDDAVLVGHTGGSGYLSVYDAGGATILSATDAITRIGTDLSLESISSTGSTIAWSNGIISHPTNTADKVKLYVADYAAGDARLYIKSEASNTPIIFGNKQIECDKYHSAVNGGFFVRSKNLWTNLSGGLLMAWDSANGIYVAPGWACSFGVTGQFMVLTSPMTKRLDANWTVGDGTGGLDVGVKTNNTGYFVYLIARSNTASVGGNVDIIFSTNAAAPTLPTNYDKYRLIGWVYVNSSGAIEPFYRIGNEYFWKDSTLIYTGASSGVAPTYQTLITIGAIPYSGGINYVAIDFTLVASHATLANVCVAVVPTGASVLTAPSLTAWPLAQLVTGAVGVATSARLRANLGSDNRVQLIASAPGVSYKIQVHSYIYDRDTLRFDG